MDPHLSFATRKPEIFMIDQLTKATSARAVRTSRVVSGRSMRCVSGRQTSQNTPLCIWAVVQLWLDHNMQEVQMMQSCIMHSPH